MLVTRVDGHLLDTSLPPAAVHRRSRSDYARPQVGPCARRRRTQARATHAWDSPSSEVGCSSKLLKAARYNHYTQGSPEALELGGDVPDESIWKSRGTAGRSCQGNVCSPRNAAEKRRNFSPLRASAAAMPLVGTPATEGNVTRMVVRFDVEMTMRLSAKAAEARMYGGACELAVATEAAIVVGWRERVTRQFLQSYLLPIPRSRTTHPGRGY